MNQIEARKRSERDLTRCLCSSYGCSSAGGKFLRPRQIAEHVKADKALIRALDTYDESKHNIALDCVFYPALYENHPSATVPLYKGASISKLDHIFIEFRKFVSHPSSSKVAVTESLRSDKYLKLPKPNESCETFTEAKNNIKEFLVPLTTYHVCVNDCVIFTGEYADHKVSLHFNFNICDLQLFPWKIQSGDPHDS